MHVHVRVGVRACVSTYILHRAYMHACMRDSMYPRQTCKHACMQGLYVRARVHAQIRTQSYMSACMLYNNYHNGMNVTCSATKHDHWKRTGNALACTCRRSWTGSTTGRTAWLNWSGSGRRASAGNRSERPTPDWTSCANSNREKALSRR